MDPVESPQREEARASAPGGSGSGAARVMPISFIFCPQETSEEDPEQAREKARENGKLACAL